MVHDLDPLMFPSTKACSTIVCILNKFHRMILKGKTPGKSFTREKPQPSHFQCFSCHVYIHIPCEKRTRLEPYSLKSILDGYNKSSKAYRVYILSQWNIVLKKDVNFDEMHDL
jgi:hypothetical protein